MPRLRPYSPKSRGRARGGARGDSCRALNENIFIKRIGLEYHVTTEVLAR